MPSDDSVVVHILVPLVIGDDETCHIAEFVKRRFGERISIVCPTATGQLFGVILDCKIASGFLVLTVLVNDSRTVRKWNQGYVATQKVVLVDTLIPHTVNRTGR